MRYFFFVLLFICAVGFLQWFNQSDSTAPSLPNISPSTHTTENPILDPIKKAEEIKETLETKNLETLDLSGQGLTKVPEYVFGRTDVVHLDISHNKLTGALQAEIRHLQKLTVLDMSNNAFTGVPAEIGQLSNLEVLDLSNNKLTGLPYELGNLQKLQVLRLSGNAYSSADLDVIKKSLPATVRIETN